MPKSRFHADEFYHPDLNYPNSINATGGYFLNEDIRAFDNSFFGINNLEATYMDPQQRELLEVVFECCESSGLTLEKLSSSNTGCYVANFTSDFQVLQAKDPETFHRYSATGMGLTILANRISHVFDLRGPNMVLDTACSSSLYSLHTACSTLISGECDGAFVAGANLIQSPEVRIATVKTGVLSGTSMCHTFDESADGYGRAEGVGAIFLKRLSDAVRDGDPVRSVSRGSNSVADLLKLAGSLFLRRYEVDIDKINCSYTASSGMTSTAARRQVLHSLPNLKWDYGPILWHESRSSRDFRNREHPRHELLGTRVPGDSGKTRTWRNVLKVKDVRWLGDHEFGQTVVFPAAGYLAIICIDDWPSNAGA